MVCFRFNVATKTRLYKVSMDTVPIVWFHGVLVYHGPGIGITLYINGTIALSDHKGKNVNYGETQGNVLLGKGKSALDEQYADASVDELYYWNTPLDSAAVQQLYSMYMQ